MDSPVYTFRQAQSAFDLIAILQSFDNDMLVRSGGCDLPRIVKNSHCRLEDETDAKCYEAPISTVLEASSGAEVALAALVSNELQRGLWSGDAKELAEMASESIKNAPTRLRTAILRGLDAVDDYVDYNNEAPSYLLPNRTGSRNRRTKFS